MVEVAELRVAAAELELAPVLEPEREPLVRHLIDLGGAAVDEPEIVVVAGPADAVPSAQLDAFRPVDLAAALAPANQATVPPCFPSSRTAPALWSTPATRRSSPFSTPSRL